MSTSHIDEINDNEIEEFNDDELEELLAKAKEESLRHYNTVELPHHQKNEQQKQILSTQVGGGPGTFLYDGIEAKGFHLSAGSTYIYPTNYPVRQYQASIVKTALFKNTLVSLPTGLGKTFIAAVVMYNFYRWYPSGKIVFMAPTRPLVAQQTKACHHIMNIPQDDTTEMTGVQSAEQRTALWKNKRVFYLTPQVMVNDLKMKTCPASFIKCVVIDEAHRATKDYAYCQVLKILSETDAVFRILALSATPGNDVNAVQQVIKNLKIEALEMRSEESLDVTPYVHSRDVNPIIFELSETILRVKSDLLQIFEKFAKRLKDFRALSMNISNINKFQVLKACEKFRANPPRGVPPAMIGSLISDFTVCMSLAHSLELLQIYGLRAFYNFLTDDSGEKTKAATTRLRNDGDLKEMLKRLQGCLYPKPNENIPYIWSHPKLQNLVKVLSDHFKNAEDKKSTKAIVFCQFRVVVTEIVELLNKSKPLINAAEFIGQSGGKEKGMPQAKQLQIMKDFRNGLVNCLVATCVAEEGLDIGEVDLIVLMEAHKSPVRLVQRLGRTGRKRKGCCIVLLTKGKEEQKFKDAMATRKSYVQNIVNAPAVKSSLCQDSPRMVPSECKPVQQLVHIHASNFESPARPGNKKQIDIRRLLTAQAPGPIHSSEEDLSKALEELANKKLIFNKIPQRHELWHKQHGEKISIEELFSNNITSLSEWNEWNMDEHETYFIGHTSQTSLLCHLLKVSNKVVSLPRYSLLPGFDSENNLHEVNKKKAAASPTDKAKRTKKDVKKNMGMDIRNCMNFVVEQNVSDENEIIEILSDNSQDFPPIIPKEPLLKRAKISLSPQKSIDLEPKSISSYEENNNLCNYLSKYMLPKKTFKKTFNFQKTLPDLDNVLSYVTRDILISINFKINKDKNIDRIVNSPIIVNSPLSSTIFDIDDLFSDEIIYPNEEEILRPAISQLSYSLGKEVSDTDMILDIPKAKINSKNSKIEECKPNEIVTSKFNPIEKTELRNKVNFNHHTTNKIKSVDVEPYEILTEEIIFEKHSPEKPESRGVMSFLNQSKKDPESNRVMPFQKQSIEKSESRGVLPFQKESIEKSESSGVLPFQKESIEKSESRGVLPFQKESIEKSESRGVLPFQKQSIEKSESRVLPFQKQSIEKSESRGVLPFQKQSIEKSESRVLPFQKQSIEKSESRGVLPFQKQSIEKSESRVLPFQKQSIEKSESRGVLPFQKQSIEKSESRGVLPFQKQATEEAFESNQVMPFQKQPTKKVEISNDNQLTEKIEFKESQSFDIDDVLNLNINPDSDWSFHDGDKEIQCFNEIKEKMTPPAKGLKTLTSSFINIHNNNKGLIPLHKQLTEMAEFKGVMPYQKIVAQKVESKEVTVFQKEATEKCNISHKKTESNFAITFTDHPTQKPKLQVFKESQSFDIDDILNEDIISADLKRSFHDDKEISRREEIKGNITPAAKVHKTLTSSFINIHNNNLKKFSSIKNKNISQRDNYAENRNITTQKEIRNVELRKEVVNFDENILFSDDDDEFKNIEEDIIIPKASQFHSTPIKPHLKKNNIEMQSEIICSPRSMKEFAAPSKMACSTPLVTVKKFKKNLVVVDNKLSNSETECAQQALDKHQEEMVVSKNKDKSPSPIDAWNLSDLLEVDEDTDTQMKPQDSTMLGITQMVSLIEREKNKNNEIEPLGNKIVATTENNPTTTTCEKSPDLSEFFDSDVDMFCDLNIQTNVKIDKDFSLSQKYVSDKIDDNHQGEISPVVKKNDTNNDLITQILDDIDSENDIDVENNLKSVENDDLPGNNNIINLGNEDEYDTMLLTQKYNFIEENKNPEMPVNEMNTDLSPWPLESESNINKPYIDLIDFAELNKDSNLKNINSEIEDLNKISEESDINEITLLDVDEYNNFDDMLTQRYTSVDENCRIKSLNLKPHVESYSTESESVSNIPIEVSKTTINGKHTDHTKDALISHTESLNSEPSQASQQSQTVNFKKFNKKVPIKPIVTAINEAAGSNTQNALHSKMETSNKILNNTEFPPKKPVIKTATSNPMINSEKIASTTNNEMNKLTAKSSSESKVRVDLFQTKKSTKTFHKFSDDSDDDVFKLPSSKNILNERRPIKRQRNELLNSPQKLESNKIVPEKKLSHKAVIPSEIISKEHKPKRSKNLKEHNGMIVIEADVSGEMSSDDSDGSSLDDLDNSFINDDTECFTQTMYLKSVKSPIGQGKYKIPQNKKYPLNVYSQHIVEEESEYMNDSFCVDTEEETDESNERSISVLEVAERELMSTKKEPLMRKRRRILNNTTSEESSTEKKRPSPLPLSEPILRTTGVARKRRRLLSESESDGSPLVKRKTITDQSVVPSSPCINTSSSLPPVRTEKINFIDITNSSSEDEKSPAIKRDRLGASKNSNIVNKFCKVVKNKPDKRNSKSKLDAKILKLNDDFAKKLENIKQKYFGSDDSSD